MTQPSERGGTKKPHQLPNWYIQGGIAGRGYGDGTAVTMKTDSVLPLEQRTLPPLYVSSGYQPEAKSTIPLTDEEKIRLLQEGSLLLAQLFHISNKFLLSETINQFENRGITSLHVTPYVTVENYPYPVAIVSAKTQAHRVSPEGDIFGPHTVVAGIVAQVSETAIITLIELRGQEDTEGNMQCTKITCANKFLASINQSGTPNPLHSVKEATRIAHLLKTQLAPLTPKLDHSLIAIDGKNRREEFVIPHVRS